MTSRVSVCVCGVCVCGLDSSKKEEEREKKAVENIRRISNYLNDEKGNHPIL